MSVRCLAGVAAEQSKVNRWQRGLERLGRWTGRDCWCSFGFVHRDDVVSDLGIKASFVTNLNKIFG